MINAYADDLVFSVIDEKIVNQSEQKISDISFEDYLVVIAMTIVAIFLIILVILGTISFVKMPIFGLRI